MWLGSVAEWFTFAVTAFAVCAAIKTLRFLRVQTAVARKTAKTALKSAVAAEDNAEAARLGAATSKAASDANIELSRTDQRAWVGTPVMEVRGPIEPGKHMLFIVFVQNFGRTPAKNVTIKAVAKPRLRSDDWVFSEPEIDVESVVVLQPTEKKELPIPTKRLLNADGLVAIRQGKQIVDVFGRIDYTDIFGVPHWTTFHGMYEPDSGYVVSAGDGNDCD